MKKFFSFLLIVLCLGISIQAQDVEDANKAFEMGKELYHKEKYEEAKPYLIKASQLFKQEFDTINHLEAMAQYFECASYSNEPASIKLQIPLFLEQLDTSIARQRLLKAYMLTSLGYIYHHHTNQYEESKKVYLQSLKLQRGVIDKATMYAYFNLADLYASEGNYKKVISYQLEAIRVAKILKMPYEAIFSNYLGLVYYYTYDEQYTLALKYSLLAKDYYNQYEKLENNFSALWKFENRIGLVYCRMKDYDTALKYLKHQSHFDSGQKISTTLMDEYHFGLTYLYITQKDFESAKKHIRSAFAYMKGSDHSGYSEGVYYNELAYLCTQLHQFDSVIHYVQKTMEVRYPSLYSNDVYSLPDLDKTYDEEWLSFPLSYKPKAFADLSLITQSPKQRQAAAEHFQFFFDLLDKMRKNFEDNGNTIGITRRNWGVYEEAIQAMIDIYNQCKDPYFQEKAFYFLEKAKASLILDGLTKNAARYQLNLPQEILNQENQLNKDIAELEHQILENQKSKQKIDHLQSQLFNLKEDRSKFTKQLAQQYPNYHQVKYRSKPISLEGLKQHLADDEAFIEFFAGDTSTFVFYIDQKEFKSFYFRNEELGNRAKQFRQQIIDLQDNPSPKSFYAYQENASFLYQKLLAPVLPKNSKKHLYIIPDGNLNFIPFEALLTHSQKPTSIDYKKLPYLINDYEISYGYSATLLFDRPKQIFSSTEGLLAFGPSYKNTTTNAQSIPNDQLRAYRSEVSELQWNQEEALKAGHYLDGKSLIGKDASEENFKKLYNDHSILHFAMHALVDDEYPMQSRLVFTYNEDDTEDDFLFAYELYNMKLNAKLAVLSACNTGYGKLQKGEGIASLGRAFAYAGCPSIAMSQWMVDDQATAILMEYFYQGLAKGMTKSTALRQAKLNYLQQAKNKSAAPFFWSSFILIGDNQPVLKDTPNWIYWLVGSCFISLLLGISILRVRKRVYL